MEGLGTIHNRKMTPKEQARYSKQTILPCIGPEGQERLLAARVLVIGAGGLGCPILQYLAAAGVGTIGIADGDNIELSNLQRQILYSEHEIGQSKAAVAAKKISALNTGLTVHTYAEHITAANALAIFKVYDIIVDGSDNFPTRYLVNDACVMLGKPMVSGAIYKFEGQVSVFNYHNGPTYRCLFPEPPGEGESPNCADIGVVATLPGIIGTIQANEVIKMITGIGEVLSGKLLVLDTLTMSSHTFSFRAVEANRHITSLKAHEPTCTIAITPIDHSQLKDMILHNNVTLVDVREIEEHSIENIGGINIPLSDLEDGHRRLRQKDTIILYCTSGIRSNEFAKRLAAKGFLHLYHLKGGMNGIPK
jgi:sulfur-carrier protein adenylyltransferase/sulfurtransferase